MIVFSWQKIVKARISKILITKYLEKKKKLWKGKDASTASTFEQFYLLKISIILLSKLNNVSNGEPSLLLVCYCIPLPGPQPEIFQSRVGFVELEYFNKDFVKNKKKEADKYSWVFSLSYS